MAEAIGVTEDAASERPARPGDSTEFRQVRLDAPDPELADDAIRLEPLTQAWAGEMLALTADPDVVRFTRVPASADAAFAEAWVGRYERGWEDGSRAGFTILDAADGAFLGFAAAVDLDLDARQGELGYMVAPAARGRGIASRALTLLTAWALGPLALERVELRIDPANAGSIRVAERAGYRLEGVLRNLHLKDGIRTDVGVWSRLRQD
jgi:RimJ/RimL family protein N-acetyltransferase